MLGLYFSGTGNSRFVLETFFKEYNYCNNSIHSIEDISVEEIKANNEIVFSFPIQYSTIPKFLYDFVNENKELWKNKRIFIIVTMALFCGDGAGVLARLLKKYDAIIIGGLHLKMPDSIADEKVLKRSLKNNIKIVNQSKAKIKKTVININKGKYPQNGLGFVSRVIGFLSQRIWFGYKTRSYSDKLKIDFNKCINCVKCAKNCPTRNIIIADNKPQVSNKCTMCYRCINECPMQAITLLGRKVIEQTNINKYL